MKNSNPYIKCPVTVKEVADSIGYCGLICKFCHEADHCGGCKSAVNCCGRHLSESGCYQYNCCKEKGLNGCWECDAAPCDKDMFSEHHDIRNRTFVKCAKQEGIEKLAQYVLHNQEKGIQYGWNKDYDNLDSEQAVMNLLHNGINRKSTAYLYVFDTMADWEASYLTAELRSGRYFKKGLQPFRVITIGNTKAPIVTMGGLKIIPDIQIDECNLDDAAVLILPGGNTWTEQIHAPILSITEKCLNNGTVVAAICGATFGLAQAGMLNQRQHTSNDLQYLKMLCPNYIGEKYYKQESAVTDENLITASGIAALDFTAHVLKKLDVFSPKVLDLWYKLYSTSNPKLFFELMSLIQ